MLKEKAIATATALGVLAVLGIVGVGVPTYVDSNVDQMPDESLYGLERAGESIKEVGVNIGLYGDKADWQVDRWEERIKEFENMVAENKAQEHMRVLERVQERIRNTYRFVDSEQGLSMAKERTSNHIRVLRQLENRVPPEAEEGIETAINNAQKYQQGLDKAEQEVGQRGSGSDVGGIVENNIRGIEEVPIGGRGR